MGSRNYTSLTWQLLCLQTSFYMCIGCISYAAFGNKSPGNLLTGECQQDSDSDCDTCFLDNLSIAACAKRRNHTCQQSLRHTALTFAWRLTSFCHRVWILQSLLACGCSKHLRLCVRPFMNFPRSSRNIQIYADWQGLTATILLLHSASQGHNAPSALHR